MKRNSFLKLCIGAGSLVTAPFSMLAKSISRKRVDRGFLVNAGKDRFDKSISLFEGDTFYTKVSTKDTDGDVYIFESTRIKEGGPALHYHFDQDEWWYVLQGEFLIKVGNETYRAKAGDSVFGPRKIPHAFAKIGDAEGKLLMQFQPAGQMEDLFIKVSQGVMNNMSGEEKIIFRKSHGIEVVGPPLTYLKQ